MKRILRYSLLLIWLLAAAGTLSAQVAENIRGLHKVKKRETIYGIALKYDITIEELKAANPEMGQEGYELKKGVVLKIPFKNVVVSQPVVTQEEPAKKPSAVKRSDVRHRAIRLGVMLPLHDINGDGRRMVEYYRGVLMACDSIKKLGVSVDVHAWNTPEDGNIQEVLRDPAAAQCDLIIGPLYSKQMEALSAFVEQHDIKLLIPFSINAPQVASNPNIYQVYQAPTDMNESVIKQFVGRFKDYHPVFIDCNDSTSKKGPFTAGLRRALELRDVKYSITSLKSGEENFSKAFSRTQPNIVILNSARSPELGVAFAKINGLKSVNKDLNVTMFGYTEWLMYTRTHLENFYAYDTYIPTAFFYNALSSASQRLQQKFRWNFHTDMQNTLPRFALTGFDHTYFFLRGLHRYGADFTGGRDAIDITPVQTPLTFERTGSGGYQNKALLFVHYRTGHDITLIQY